MTFTVRGTTRIPAGEERDAELTWHAPGERVDDRAVTGHFHLAVEARIRADHWRQVCATPTGPCFPASLDEPRAAFLIVLGLFEAATTTVTGDEPYIDWRGSRSGTARSGSSAGSCSRRSGRLRCAPTPTTSPPAASPATPSGWRSPR
jgi:hypothetical protein